MRKHTYKNKPGMDFQETNQAAQKRQHMGDERWRTGSVATAPVQSESGEVSAANSPGMCCTSTKPSLLNERLLHLCL